ncbi:hypothetical protein [Streptomyces sp. NPDC048106]|uniref:hypothetical protein n=1 Tax=Streptomyces sp. NPDC048106 TaxID=3155750 RepID=UPI003455BF87
MQLPNWLDAVRQDDLPRDTAVLSSRTSYSVQQPEISMPTSLLQRAHDKFGPLSPSSLQHP